MENKFSHIDSFFKEKLDNLHADPNKEIWDKISHSLDPIDMAMGSMLSNVEVLEDTKSKNSIFLALENNSHPIDIALHDRLANLESGSGIALSEIPIEEKKKRKKAIWFIFPVIVFLCLLTLNNGFLKKKEDIVFENNSSKKENQVQGKTNNSPSEKTTKSEGLISSKANGNAVEDNRKHKSLQEKSMKSRNKTNSEISRINLGNLVAERSILSNSLIDEIQALKITSYKKFQYPINLEVLKELKRKTLHFPLEIWRPMGISLNLGYLNEITTKTTMNSDGKTHRDALNNYENGNTYKRSGFQISAQIFYIPDSKFMFKTGIQASSSSTSKVYQYEYKDIPVYGIDGNIIGYFTRPPSARKEINEPINTQTRSLSLPVEIMYKLAQFKKFALWVGGGGNVRLVQSFKTKVFNFETEKMEEVHKINGNSLQQKVCIQLYYALRPGLSFSVQLQNEFKKQNIQGAGNIYQSNIQIPSFNIGLTYLPNLLKK